MAQICHSWSDIAENPINLEKLRLLCSHEKALKKEGYVVAQLKPHSLLAKLRCQNCGKHMKTIPAMAGSEIRRNTSSTTKAVSRKDLCEFHPGRVINLHFTCCQAHVSNQKGCHIEASHKAPENYMDALQHNWTYYQTPVQPNHQPPPSQKSSANRDRARFQNITPSSTRTAIALDCEFGVSVSNEPELIRLTAIDFFTKQVLVNSLVKPDVIIKNYVTRYSGITAADMRMAVRANTCIFGRDVARARLLEFVGPETIVVMHGGSSDMTSLRWIHPNILDTFILETYFDPLPGGRSLRNLCEKKFAKKIQGGKGHDSHEDALACRELAIWVMNLIPET